MHNYALAGEVLDWIAQPYGECDRAKLWPVLNEIRQRMYLLYESLPLFDITMCFEVQEFCAECNICRDTYRGVTLPREFQNVEAMWYGDTPVELYSSWREWQQGIAPECSCALEKYDLPGSFASERDPIFNRPERLRVSPILTADFGGTAVVRYIDHTGVNHVESLPLQLNGALTEFPARGLAQGAGFSKKRTQGGVTLSTESGRMLSMYAPDETVPSYRRIKITGIPQFCAQVNIRGSRKFHPVYAETDVVETDNRVAFAEMARFIRINEKPSQNADDLRTMQAHAGQAKIALSGEKAREHGKSTRAELRIESGQQGPPRIGPY